jgi:hypothetical protein
MSIPPPLLVLEVGDLGVFLGSFLGGWVVVDFFDGDLVLAWEGGNVWLPLLSAVEGARVGIDGAFLGKEFFLMTLGSCRAGG